MGNGRGGGRCRARERWSAHARRDRVSSDRLRGKYEVESPCGDLDLGTAEEATCQRTIPVGRDQI